MNEKTDWGDKGQVLKGGLSLPSLTTGGYSLSVNNQACDIIFFSNNVS
jgi:hypothetical protein